MDELQAIPGQVAGGRMLKPEERQWGMFAHLSGLAGMVVPFGNIIGPLIIWLIKKDESAFVADQGREALNFQLTLTIAILAAVPLCLVLIGFVVIILLPIYGIVMEIIAGMKANEGETYRYPCTLRLIK